MLSWSINICDMHTADAATSAMRANVGDCHMIYAIQSMQRGSMIWLGGKFRVNN